jgi:hypothetical protein
MNIDNFTDFKLPKDAYLSFDANSLKELIIERLNENEAFTDQNFEGSNFSAFIDVVAYMYHVLLFYLNTTSNESTFTTATIYENMSKLVSNIGYKPLGDQTSILDISLQAQGITAGVYVLPKFSFVNVGASSYYTLEDITFEKVESNVLETLEVNYSILHQGTLKEAIFSATGEGYETITLIDSYTSPQVKKTAKNISDEQFIADNTFSVYVKNNVTGDWSQWTETSSLFLEAPGNMCYEKRLNHDGNYEFKFGDNNNGFALREGDSVVVFYVVSDNESGLVGNGSTNGSNFNLFNTSTFTEIKNQLYVDVDTIQPAALPSITVNNEYASTPIKLAESVEDIRNNVSKIFSSQDRLVSKVDYEAHVDRNFGNITRPVKVLSNDDYTSQVLFYFNNIGVKRGIDDSRTLLSQVNFSTSTNFNNIYVYTVRTSQPVLDERIPHYLNEGQKKLIADYCNKKKDITHNVVISDPIFKAFSFGVGEVTENNTIDNIVNDSMLRVTVDRNVSISDAAIRSGITKVIKNTFKSIELGSLLNTSQITKDILNIDGIIGLETVNGNNVTPNLSFVVWNPDYRYIDNTILARDYKLKDFEYAYFYKVSDVADKVTIRRV